MRVCEHSKGQEQTDSGGTPPGQLGRRRRVSLVQHLGSLDPLARLRRPTTFHMLEILAHNSDINGIYPMSISLGNLISIRI